MKTNQSGFTLIEVLISILLISILIIGLTVTTTNLKEYMRRSNIERMYDQYCNDVVEYISLQLKNSDQIEIRHLGRDIDKVTLYQRNIFNGKSIERIFSATQRGVYEKRTNDLLFFTNLENLKKNTWNIEYNILYFNIDMVYDERDHFTNDFINSFYEVSIGIEIIVDRNWIIYCDNFQQVLIPNYKIVNKG